MFTSHNQLVNKNKIRRKKNKEQSKGDEIQ